MPGSCTLYLLDELTLLHVVAESYNVHPKLKTRELLRTDNLVTEQTTTYKFDIVLSPMSVVECERHDNQTSCTHPHTGYILPHFLKKLHLGQLASTVYFSIDRLNA